MAKVANGNDLAMPIAKFRNVKGKMLAATAAMRTAGKDPALAQSQTYIQGAARPCG